MPKLKPNLPIPPAPPEVTPNNTFGKLTSELARMGYNPARVREELGASPAGRDKSEIIQLMRTYLNSQEAREVRYARFA